MRELLPLFPKPGHYAGIEDGIRKKDPASVKLHIALAFPDAYEVGMSYLGQKILYGIVNDHQDWLAERVMAPEPEAAAIMLRHNAPLATLESDTPLARTAAVCFSITHELCYTDVLRMLDLAHIPLRSENRDENILACPIVMAGGGAMLGAEPLTPFIDLAALGDGEEVLPEILGLLQTAREEGWQRSRFLAEARHIHGVYVPSLFKSQENGALSPVYPDYRPRRRIVADLNDAPYPASQVAPIGAVQNRLSMEIARGCTRGCRFCHAGMVYRPVRERTLENISDLLNSCLNRTGFEEVSFLALSAGDFSALKSLCARAWERCSQEQISLSLPSLRVGSVDDDIMAQMASLRRTGCTLAPEAGSQRLRDVINKGISEEDLLLHARGLLKHGWRQVKLYFMIGLPTETDADLEEIASLCRKVRDAGGPGGQKLQVTASISPFVPKPFTPFQWEEQIGRDEIRRRIQFVLSLFKGQKSMKLRWHEPDASHLEGILSRADRRMADVVEAAYRKGAVFCGWTEFFNLAPWLEALAECGLQAEDFIRARVPGEKLPWSHLEAGVSERFLMKERERAYRAKITEDCRYHSCRQCGSCDTKAGPSLMRPALGNADTYANRLVFRRRDQAARQPADERERPAARPGKQSLPQLNSRLAFKAAQYRLWHVKLGGFAFLSHLELQAAITRALRRARLPVAFSQGFHPLPLLSFGRALPVGVASEVEWFALTLHSHMRPEKLADGLNSFLYRELAVFKVEFADSANRSEQSVSETFRLELADDSMLMDAASCFADFAAKEHAIYTRITKKGEKTEDIRPLLLNWRVCVASGQKSAVTFSTDWMNGYLSPQLLAEEILAPMLADKEAKLVMKIVKTGQTFANGREYAGLARY